MPVRVLYTDDEEDIREVAVFALGLDPDMEVRAAPSGSEALALLETWRPDIMLLDVMMPGMDGPETLVRIQQMPQLASLPVVFITARTQAHEVQRFLSLGAVGVIAKPFDPMTLAATTRSYLS